MKTNMIATALVAGLALVGCKPENTKVPQADSPAVTPKVEASRSTATSDRAAAEQRLSNELKSVDAKMAELKAQAQRAGDKAKSEWEARRPQLEAQREALAKKLDEVKNASQETWREMQPKLEAALSELNNGFKDAWARIRE
jgi:predicted transcriptional regulator